jgi:glycosyltransferase involved in cell wall biosynthesis
VSKALVVYMEPTSYTVPLIERLRTRWRDGIDVLYVGQDLSQEWGAEWGAHGATILPGSRRQAISEVWRRIGSGAYGLVHLAGWGHPVLAAALLAARWRGVPATVESDTALSTLTPSWKRVVKRLVFPRLFRIPAAFLPGGSRQASYLRTFGVDERRITVARMTVDTARISSARDAVDPAERARDRAERGIPTAATVFLYVGRLEDHKGLRVLLQAFEMIQPPGDGQAPWLLVVGDGSLRDVVAEAARRNGRVVATGRLSGAALLRAYAMADAFVLPSLFEPWGLVVNEAMASGLPVIATDRVGCVDDLVIEGRTGCVVEAASADKLTAAMGALAANSERRARLGRAGRELIGDWSLEGEADLICSTWRRASDVPNGRRAASPGLEGP